MAKQKPSLPKARTGIQGLDEITDGGLPRGRPTLVSGAAGCGKTMLAMEFLVRGAMEFGEPGVFMMFEERPAEIAANMRSLGFDLDHLVAKNKIALDYVHVERSEIEETGAYDLEGLFIRLGYAIDKIGAKRVVLDTIEALFGGLSDHVMLRAELRRLFQWLKDRGITALITGESAEGSLTRFGFEDYLADCVIALDHRVIDQISTRRLRIIKYRGTSHGTNEYPFIIGNSGLSVLPITSLTLQHKVTSERVSTGCAGLDDMLGGKGVFRGSSVLVSGSAGTGKSSVVATFIDAACRRGERCLLFSFEESPDQVTRNMRSIGIDLGRWVKKRRLRIHSSRPSFLGLEQHLVVMHDAISDFKPDVVGVDPISSLMLGVQSNGARSALLRLVDFLKQRGTTGVFSSLIGGEETPGNDFGTGISSLMDAWIQVRNFESDGEQNRLLLLHKSRGMAHSNRVREFLLTNKGIELVDVFIGEHGVLTGSARMARQDGKR